MLPSYLEQLSCRISANNGPRWACRSGLPRRHSRLVEKTTNAKSRCNRYCCETEPPRCNYAPVAASVRHFLPRPCALNDADPVVWTSLRHKRAIGTYRNDLPCSQPEPLKTGLSDSGKQRTLQCLLRSTCCGLQLAVQRLPDVFEGNKTRHEMFDVG